MELLMVMKNAMVEMTVPIVVAMPVMNQGTQSLLIVNQSVEMADLTMMKNAMVEMTVLTVNAMPVINQ